MLSTYDPYNTPEKRTISTLFLEQAQEILPKSGFSAVCFPGPNALEVHELHKAFPKIQILGIERKPEVYNDLRWKFINKSWFKMLPGSCSEIATRIARYNLALSHLDYEGWPGVDSDEAVANIAANTIFYKPQTAILRITNSHVPRNTPSDNTRDDTINRVNSIYGTDYTSYKEVPFALRYLSILEPRLNSFSYGVKILDNIKYHGSNCMLSTFWFLFYKNQKTIPDSLDKIVSRIL